MLRLIDILKQVHKDVHDLNNIKKKYSGPKIYTGGVKISEWNRLSAEKRKQALKKSWYLYYSYRNPATGKLVRQPNIKAGVNYYKTKEERIEILETLSRNLSRLLNEGYNPYSEKIEMQETMSIEQAFSFALNLKKSTLSKNSYPRFKNRINRFKQFLFANGYNNRFITSIDKKIVLEYLNVVLKKTSARTRNNTRSDISSLFSVFESNEIIPTNFIANINVLKAPPVRNKTYSNDKVDLIFEYLKTNDPQLLLFIKFVSYNFLRPIEVCRLRIKDINLVENILTLKAKNKAVKRKIIPSILISEIPDLSKYSNDDLLFTPAGEPGQWNADLNNRRDYFTKRFKKIKDHFKLGAEYGIYSFRHTSITNLYRELRKQYSPFEVKSKLMLITGHASMSALEKYLRDLDTEMPEDYSDLLS